MNTAVAHDAIGAPVVTSPLYYYGSQLSENLSRTPEGFLVCRNVPVARTGWQEYTAEEIGAVGGSDRKVRVYRAPQEVFNPRSIATMEGKPVTEMHPPVFVSPYNYGAYLKGHVQNVRASGFKDEGGEQLLLADLVIVDAGLISKIENGLREISVGYSCDYEPVTEGSNDYVQRNIVVNHVAVVLSARAGNDVRIYDSVENKEQPMPNETTSSPSAENGLSAIQQVVGFLKSLGFKSPTEVRDAESEAVKKAEESAEEATKSQDDDDDDDDKGTKDSKRHAKDSRRTKDARRAKDSRRTRDDDDDDDDDKTKDSKARDARRTKDDDDDDDWHRRVTDLEERLANLEGGDDQPPPPPPESEEEELGDDDQPPATPPPPQAADDHDLVPVETQSREDRPKNPIPGATTASSDARTVDALRRIRPVIARYGTRDDKVQFNRAMAAAKGKRFNMRDNRFGYGALANRKKPALVEGAEARAGAVGTTDSNRAMKEANQFVEMAKQFHKKNVNEVVLQIPKLPA